MRRITEHIPNLRLIIFILIFSADYYYNQSVSINGNVSTIDGMPVYNALITSIEEIDTTKKYSAVTDTSGNYQIDIITAIKEEPIIPQTIELAQNYPNPFSSATAIPYKMNKPLEVNKKIFDILRKQYNLSVLDNSKQEYME